MRSFVVFAALAALAFAGTVTYEPPKRDCGWNVEITRRKMDDNSVIDYVKYWNFGRFLAKEVKNSDKKVTEHAVLRPDLENKTFVFSGECKEQTSTTYWIGDVVLLQLLQAPKTFDNSEETTYNGKKCTKYYSSVLGVETSVLYVKDKEPIAYNIAGVGRGDIDYGGRAWMIDFALSKTSEGGCADGAYKEGDRSFSFCAASSVKAVLAVVLAAIAVALLF